VRVGLNSTGMPKLELELIIIAQLELELEYVSIII
jgi:hypothetical protein